MGVQVDEAGADDEAAGIRREIRRRRLPGEAEDLSVFQKDVQPRVDAPGRVDNPPVSDPPSIFRQGAFRRIPVTPGPAAALRPGRFRDILPAA